MLVVTSPPRARMRAVAVVVTTVLGALVGTTFLVSGTAVALPQTIAGPAKAVADVTTTAKAQRSPTYRATVTLAQWQASRHGKRIAWRESHNVCTAVSADGRFRGKWQMTKSLWLTHGGRKFARTPQRATCLEQDTVARRVWVASWWWPWGG